MPRLQLNPWKDPVPILQEAEWTSGPDWTGAEILASPEFDPWTVQSIGSRYTDYATRSTQNVVILKIMFVSLLCMTLFEMELYCLRYQLLSCNNFIVSIIETNAQ